MENNMSRILIETVVRRTLKDMKENPERSIRNLVDMALHFSEGRFQKNFFQAAQTMLKNENSPYYALLRNISSSVDTERLVTFGMNLGYNSCTLGAKKIRENEQELGCSIPWTVAFQTDRIQISGRLAGYHAAVADGERLGIYAWTLFAQSHPQDLLPLIREHSDSAFFLFCDPHDIDTAFLDSISDMNNLMLVIRYEETAEALYAQIRKNGLLYSAYYTYSREDIFEPGVFFSKAIFCVKPIVAFALPGCIGNQICASGRNADPKVKGDILLHAVIQNAGGINSAITASYIHDTNLMLHSVFSLSCVCSRSVLHKPLDFYYKLFRRRTLFIFKPSFHRA